MNRRQLLKALGLTGLGLASGRVAFGQDLPGAVRRLIIVSNGHGNVHSRFALDVPNRDPNQAWTADLADVPTWSPILEPLARHAQHLNIIDGLSLATAELDLPGYRHEKGWVHAWTGDNALLTGSELAALSPSIDQHVARAIARSDRLPSIELSVGEGRPIAHAGRAQPLPLLQTPHDAFQRLFGGAPGDVPEATGSILDFALAEYDGLIRRVGVEERQRLEQHRDEVRALERRLDGLAAVSCPEAILESDPDGYEASVDAMSDLIVAAFRCDVTRVATLSLGDLPADTLPNQPESGEVHDSWAHLLYGRQEALDGMTGYMATHAAQLARLLDRLAETEDPQGGSLLDHTLVVWGSEMADGWHGYERYCVVMAGGGWAFQGGRVHHTPYRTGPIELVTWEGMHASGVPHQHLLVSIARAMGLDVNHIGLDAVVNRQGDLVDLTGPLEGL